MLLLEQVLLIVAVAALLDSGWRIARAIIGPGLLRLLITVTLASAAAVLCALGLGLVSVGGSPAALTLAAAAVWLGVRVIVTARGPSPSTQLVSWWASLSPAARAGRAALLGAATAYSVWLLRHPVLGLDALTDHLALPVDWVHNGRPGSLVAVNDSLPYANYPNTHEVLVAWVTAISRTLVPALLLTPASLVLLAVSVRAGLAELRVRSGLAWLAAGAAATLPIAVAQLAGPNTDVPAAAWLACTAALSAAAARRGQGRLLAVALIAAGLAVGTKTTPAPLAVLCLLLGTWGVRRDLRHHWRAPAVGLVVAVGVGGVWYIRNLIDHGAPLWPLQTTPWGDAIPAPFRAIQASLLHNFSPTLHGRVGLYELALAGGLVLLIGALTAIVWDRRRVTAWGSLVVLAALLVWANAPYTGISASTQLAVGATRYLIPCLLAAAVTIALARRCVALAAAILAGALLFNLDRDWILHFPTAPAPRLILAGAAAGAVLGALAHVPTRGPRPRVLGAAAAAVGVAALLVALLVPVSGYLGAHAATDQFDAGLVRWLNGRQAFRHGDAPVAIGPVQVATVTGARLTHPVILVTSSERCSELTDRAQHSWLVLQLGSSAQAFMRDWLPCLRRTRPAYVDPNFVVYAPPALQAPGS